MSEEGPSAEGLAHPLALARALIRCPSVTPADGGALDVLQEALTAIGFTCHRLPFEEPGTAPVDNLYARRGSAAPNFCFAGHTDVVPPGARAAWTREPFAATVEDGVLYGRGASDMKGAIAAFVAACARFGKAGAGGGSISLLITGDEEGPAINGTRKVLAWLAGRGETLDACLVGEPTNPDELGEMVKIGRRGSLNGTLRVAGRQGHVAYPALADNPLPRLRRPARRPARLEARRGNGRTSSRAGWSSPPSMSATRRPTSFPPPPWRASTSASTTATPARCSRKPSAPASMRWARLTRSRPRSRARPS